MKRKNESGALATVATQDALRLYTRRLFFRALICVVAVNVLDAIVLRTNAPTVIAAVAVFLMALATLLLLVCLYRYAQVSLMRHVLSHSSWLTTTGCSRMVFAGPVPVARVVVAQVDLDKPFAVDRVRPLRFSSGLPTAFEANNLWVASYRRRRMYSAPGGGTPVLASPIRFSGVRKSISTLIGKP